MLPTPGRPEPCWAPYGHGRRLEGAAPSSLHFNAQKDLSWEEDRQMGSTLGSEQRFQAAPGFVPEHVCLKAHVCTHSHSPTQLRSCPNILVTEKCTFSLIPRTHRQSILEEVPSAQASHWPSGSKHTCFRRCFPRICQHFLTFLRRPWPLRVLPWL